MRKAVAGVDVGNSTTEVVLVDAMRHPPRPLAWDRIPTRGRKGSAGAAGAAAALVQRLARREGITLTQCRVAPQHPVDTLTATVHVPRRSTGRLVVVADGAPTPGRAGFGVGRPCDVRLAEHGPSRHVVLVPATVGYEEAAVLLRARTLDSVAAVLVEADEGVLVARRCGLDVPVLDRVDVAAAGRCDLLAVEVAEAGSAVRRLADPLALVADLQLDAGDRDDAAGLARMLSDTASAVVGLNPARSSPPAEASPARDLALHAGSQHPVPLADLLPLLRDQPPGWVTGYHLAAQPGTTLTQVADLWLLDVAAAQSDVEARRGPGSARDLVVCALSASSSTGPSNPVTPGQDAATSSVVPASVLQAALGVPVMVPGTEAAAARAGALTTPGARAASLVLDLGGGTIDVVAPDGAHAVVAGAGEMVTAAVAAVLGISRAAAEWVKRGPCARLETPHLALGEDGSRTFLERTAAPDAVGALAVPGPAGWLPFDRRLSPAEWRALRLRIKRAALGDNLRRAARPLDLDLDLEELHLETGRGTGDAARHRRWDVVLTGGVAGDAEILRVLDQALPGSTVGRADVAGMLGHRWAVAYGLTVL